MYSKSVIENSKLYKSNKESFEKAHPGDDFVYELNLALSSIPSGCVKSYKWLKIYTYDLREAFGWRESPQGISYWSKVK